MILEGKTIKELINEAPEFRRQAFVDCLMQMKAKDNVIGYFGNNIDEAYLRGFGLVPIPIEGIDPYIFQHGEAEGCDVIRSTLIYLKTEKCPLLYSSKMYVTDGQCRAMESELKKNTTKRVISLPEKSDDELKQAIKEVYNREFSEEKYHLVSEMIDKINQNLESLKGSSLSGLDLFLITYFSRYLIDLQDRFDYITYIANQSKNSNNKGIRKPIRVLCPGGIYREIDRQQENKSYELIVDFNYPDFSCRKCVFEAETYVSYEKGV